jgi:rfaE bifunctional protein nucleotidyltransferase chain/domain/rfaE bifunctional protein kinase chain/domain
MRGPARGPLVIIGDALLDIDLEGRAGRLTPDAPVPVLDDLVERPRPGGAGVAALMARRDGAEVVLVAAVGDDDSGARLRSLLEDVDLRSLPYDGPTPVKQRVRAGGQSLLRLDHGGAVGRVGLPDPTVRDVLAGAAAVLVSDYGRGVTGEPTLRRWLAELSPRIPVVWDPHPRGSRPVPGVRLATPNRAEADQLSAMESTATSIGHGTLASAGRHAEALVRAWRAQAVVVTLGEGGALLSYGAGAPVVVPAPAVTVTDPCGAGDRFATSAAMALGSGTVTTEAVQAAVCDAAAYVAAGGPASLREAEHPPRAQGASAEEVARRVAARGGTVVATGGCFDLLHAGHVASLRAARRLGDCLVVCLNSDASVRRLKGPGRPLVPAADRVGVLEALECVDAVLVFDEDTPIEALRRVRPGIWAKGGDYAGRELPEAAVLREWGGQAVVLPYLEGRSTSHLVRTAARGGPTTEERHR